MTFVDEYFDPFPNYYYDNFRWTTKWNISVIRAHDKNATTIAKLFGLNQSALLIRENFMFGD